ncbi:MAG: SRPBCC domain-containing protein [Actinomycetota bacterium]
MGVEIHDGITVRVTRKFDHSPSSLFRAFTVPELAAEWMWAGLGTDHRAEIDLRVGGRYKVAMTMEEADVSWPGTERAMRGVFVEIVPDRRLVYTLHWDADVGYNKPCLESIDEAVAVELEPSKGGTCLVFTHMGLPGDAVSAEAHADGIEASLDLLNALLDEQS